MGREPLFPVNGPLSLLRSETTEGVFLKSGCHILLRLRAQTLYFLISDRKHEERRDNLYIWNKDIPRFSPYLFISTVQNGVLLYNENNG
jgi:hypothetical protein